MAVKEKDRRGAVGFAISPREMLEFILHNWYWFVLSLLVCVGGVYAFLLTVTPQYSHRMVMMVKSDSKGKQISDISDMIDAQNGYTGMGIQNEMYILRSYKFACEIVERLHLDVAYQDNSGLHTNTLFNEAPVTVSFLSPYSSNVQLHLTPIDLKQYRLNSYTISDQLFPVDKVYNYGDTVNSGAGNYVVAVRSENLKAYANRNIDVLRFSHKEAALACQNSLASKTAEDASSLIEVDCTGDNISKIDAILSTLIDVYNEAIVEDRNRIAVNTAKFIDDRIIIIGKELGEVEEELTELKQRSIVVSSSAQGGQSLSSTQTQTKEVETNLYVAQQIKKYLQNAASTNELIPNVAGVGDANVQTQISQYNELLLQREKLLKESGAKNIVVQGIEKNLAELRGTIDGSMNNYISNLSMLLGKARSNERQAVYNMQMIPKQEHMALSVTRQQSIKEALYTFLLNKREENALQLAITQADIRVIETPFGSDVPISPKRKVYYIIAIIMALLIPIICKLIQAGWNVGVRNRDDVQNATTIPVLGEVPALPKKTDESKIWEQDDAYGIFQEAVKILRSNIRFAARGARVIMFTSTLPNEGKSFICRNLAKAMALAGKRTIVIDADMRKRTQTVLFNKKRQDGLSTFLAEQTDKLKDIVLHNCVANNVDLIPAGQIPPNPSELLMSERLDALIDALKQKYDYVLIDNVPAMSLSDSTELNRVADITLYVVKCGTLDRRLLSEIQTLYDQKKYRRMYIVLNGGKLVHQRYGYKYGYSYKSKN